MDSSNAEKAFDAYAEPIRQKGFVVPPGGSTWAGFMAGRASRDAEVAELTAKLAEQTDLAADYRKLWLMECDRRDALTAERDAALKALAESRARFGDSEARRAELEAVIEKVRALAHTMDRGVGYRVSGDHSTWGEYHEGKSDFSGEVEDLLDTARSVVLAARDRENRAIGWDEAIDHVEPVLGQTMKRAAHADNPYRGDNR